VRASVGHADPASGFESYFPRSYERGYGVCPTRVGAKQEPRVGRRGFTRAGCRARVWPHQTLADVEVIPAIELKAVLVLGAARSANRIANREYTLFNAES